MKILLFVRHGETTWNGAGRLQGQTDIALSETGRHQVLALRELVASMRPTQVICSDLQRTRETAALLGHTTPQVDTRLREADLGEWTTQSIAALQTSVPELYRDWRASRYNPPGAETWHQLCNRVGTIINELQTCEGVTLIVTHGGPIRAACATLIDLHPSEIMPVAPASLTVFSITDRPRLVCFNMLPDRIALDSPD
jgi:broad specificity phosphatase PhoE